MKDRKYTKEFNNKQSCPGKQYIKLKGFLSTEGKAFRPALNEYMTSSLP
jgi:hypothetical protein